MAGRGLVISLFEKGLAFAVSLAVGRAALRVGGVRRCVDEGYYYVRQVNSADSEWILMGLGRSGF